MEALRELFWVAASAALIAGYQLWRWRRARRDPLYSVHAVNCVARTAWVRLVMSDPSQGILGIQTLRNSVMAASLMASTAVLLSVGVLSVASDPQRFAVAWHAFAGAAAEEPRFGVVKILALLASLFTAFFFFALAVRGFNHAGYLIALRPPHAEGLADPGRVAALLNRAGLYQNLGLRVFLICIPLVFWLFGPRLMFAASVGLVFALRHLDRAPPASAPQAPS
jgi:uncharacterized membrane protein